MKKHQTALSSLGLIGALGLAAAGSAAQQEDYDRAARELNIMSHIFQTSIEEDGSDHRYAYGREPDSLYLAGQGMVFTFNVNSLRNSLHVNGNFKGQDWEEFGESMAQFAGNVVNQVMDSFPDMDFDFDDDIDLKPAVPPIPAMPGKDSDSQRRIIADMNEEMRGTQQEVQGIQRQIRGVQRELRKNTDDEESRADLNRLTASLDPVIKKLQDQQKAYFDYMEEYQKQAQARQEAWSRDLSGRMIQALCDYGKTLKSLDDNEHITLIFENYSDNKNQVFVFPFKAVAECISSEKLQTVAVSYLM
ncbi:MAG: hypothetical protein RQ899_11920 [Pseudomonadales bacterium]|nr:hypothetical protein [Pseudomonadales bacterium]